MGGLSSSRAVPAQIAGGVTEGGVSGVLLSETVAVATALSQSCMPIGPGHEITDCQGNVIIELDGRPALDVFKQEIGEELAGELRRVGGLIFAALPVSGSDTGDYLVRNIMGFDVERGLIGIGELVERGTLVQFCRRDADAAEQDLGRMVDSVKRRAGAEPRGALYFTCLARGPNMFGEASEELRLIERTLGDVPLVGFFCNGEISHNRLYRLYRRPHPLPVGARSPAGHLPRRYASARVQTSAATSCARACALSVSERVWTQPR